MRKKRQFIFSLCVIVLLRIFDLYTTYVYTPQLTDEWNPLVRVLGFSWSGFIATQAVIVGIVGILMYFYFQRRAEHDAPKHLSYNDFIDYYFYEKIGKWPQRFYAIPKSLRKTLVFNGFVFMVLATGVSIFAIINNLLIISDWTDYIKFLSRFDQSFYLLFIAAITFASFRIFFMLEYRSYKNAGS